LIQLPSNVDQLAQGLESLASEAPFQGKISEKTMNMREKSLRHKLVQKCLSELEKNSQLVSTDSAISMSIITNDQVPDISLAKLKEQPTLPKKQSINDFVSTHDKSQIYVQVLEEAKKEEQQTITKQPRVMSDGTNSDSDEDSSDEAEKRA
jgi:hypothetical protein